MNDLLRILAPLFLFLPLSSVGQSDDGNDHQLAIRGDVQAVQASSSDLFKNNMQGVIGGDLSLHVPFARNFFVAGGGRISFFERVGDPSILLQKETTMMSYGPFLEGGFQPYLGDIFFLEVSVKASYRFLEFQAPVCSQNGRKEVHTQQTPSAEPQLGLWWDAGDGLKFGAIVGYELMWERFQNDLICEDPEPSLSSEDNYRTWNFGFSFNVDLK